MKSGRASLGVNASVPFWVAAVLLVLVCINPASAAPKRVLLLHSFGRDFAPFSVFSGEFRTELAQKSPEPIDFYDISLDAARFADGEQDGPFADYLRSLFANRSLDLVVPIGGPAVRFVQRNRQRLFETTPMLIAAVDQRHLNESALTDNDAVVAVNFDLPRIIDNIVQVLPETRDVEVVLGNSPLEKFWLTEIQRESQSYAGRVHFTWLNELSFSEIRKRLAALPPHSAIFYAQFSVDAEGVPHEEEQALADLHAVANAPIFGVQDYQLGKGIVGGPLMSIQELSRDTAAVAVGILRGESPGSIKTPVREPSTPAFDWRELRRWGIHEGNLPAGSLIQFREPTFWGTYKWHLAVVLSLCVAEALLILVLLASRAKWRAAQRSLRESEVRLRTILDTAVEAIISIDEHGKISALNASALRIFGYNADELIGQNIRMLMPPSGSDEHDAYLSSFLRTGDEKIIGSGREVVGLRKDGSIFPMDLSISEASIGGRRIFIGFVRDISERKEAERTSRDLSGRLIKAQEDERARLARELHDDVTQRLARLAIDVGRLERDDSTLSAPQALREIQEGLVRLSEDVHAVAYQLHPSVLEDLGLADAIRTECEHFSRRQSIPAEVKVRDLPDGLPRETAMCLFRVTQEALRNVVRHAEARVVEISLAPLDRGLQLAVRDDGIGFDPARHRARPSLGLASMLERTRLLGGELDIDSAPGRGTTVVAWVPLKGASL